MLRCLLANSALLCVGSQPTGILKSPDHLFEVLCLAHELLPPVTSSVNVIAQVSGLMNGCRLVRCFILTGVRAF